jgi:hypothetical protein
VQVPSPACWSVVLFASSAARGLPASPTLRRVPWKYGSIHQRPERPRRRYRSLAAVGRAIRCAWPPSRLVFQQAWDFTAGRDDVARFKRSLRAVRPDAPRSELEGLILRSRPIPPSWHQRNSILMCGKRCSPSRNFSVNSTWNERPSVSVPDATTTELPPRCSTILLRIDSR